MAGVATTTAAGTEVGTTGIATTTEAEIEPRVGTTGVATAIEAEIEPRVGTDGVATTTGAEIEVGAAGVATTTGVIETIETRVGMAGVVTTIAAEIGAVAEFSGGAIGSFDDVLAEFAGTTEPRADDFTREAADFSVTTVVSEISGATVTASTLVAAEFAVTTVSGTLVAAEFAVTTVPGTLVGAEFAVITENRAENTGGGGGPCEGTGTFFSLASAYGKNSIFQNSQIKKTFKNINKKDFFSLKSITAKIFSKRF